MPRLQFVSSAAFLIPLLVQCAPAPLDDHYGSADLLLQELDVTTTIISTSIETSVSTTTVYTSSTTTPTPTSDPEAVLFLPLPGVAKKASASKPSSPLVSDSPPSSSSSFSSSTPAPTPIATPENDNESLSTASDDSSPLVMAYYPDWAADKFPPEKIDFSRVDWVDFAFAIPDENFNLSFDGSDNAPDLLNRLTTAAHNSGKKVKLSVGGWTGSKFFSPAVSTSANRQTLASNILDFYKQYNLDGIDIDWEYPGQQGDSANKVSTSDTANFLEFLKLLKSVLPEGAKITAATMTVPFANENGEPSDDVSAFADVLDWILVMNYDTWGSSSTPGANAPLNDGCKNSTQPSANALSAVQTWSNAGFPVSQIVLGVPSYGYISRSSAITLRSRSLSRRSPQYDTRPANTFGHSLEGTATVANTQSEGDGTVDEDTYKGGIVIATNEDGGTDDGQVQFRQLVDQGVLKFRVPSSQAADGSNSGDDDSLLFADHLIKNYFTGFNDFTRYWDQCSNTPFLRSSSARQVISYDDPQSLEMKARFAKEAGLKGINMFDIHGDTDDWDLIDGVRRGLGLNPVSDPSR